MGKKLETEQVERLRVYFEERIGRHLRDRRKRESFAMYAFGILSEGERKSAEPIAARACADPERMGHTHHKILHFLARSTWCDRTVRREAARYVVEALAAREAVTTWIVDDTGFLKQGTHSVGVQRQYTGSAGKIANCQLGVSLVIATPTEHVPIDFELYLPESWVSDPARRKKAHIPAGVVFRTKIELAIDMMRRAHADGVPGELVLADAFYGRASEFRETVRDLGLDYAVAVDSDTHVRVIEDGLPREGPIRADAVATERREFRRVPWREGTNHTMASRFCFRRVLVGKSDEPQWLVIEWPEHEAKPTKFVLTTLPRRLGQKQIVRLFQERWRTERAYEDLKGELGLDHFEGRSFPGWHHHVTVVLCCYAFIIAERTRHFPPSGRRSHSPRSQPVAA